MWELVYSVIDQPVIYGLLLNVAMIVVPVLGFRIGSVTSFFYKLSVLLAWTFFITCVVFILNTAGLAAGWYVLAILAAATLLGTILGSISAGLLAGEDKI